MNRPDLKPCPFCGSPANLWRTNSRVYVQCSNFSGEHHLVQISARDEKSAIVTWNTRTEEIK